MSAIALLAEIAFSTLVAASVAWPFLRAAKKLQNRVFGPLFIALSVCDAAYLAGVALHRAQLQAAALLIAVDLYVLLLVMMGGRVLPAAVAGHYYRRGRVLEDRVQPPLEKAALAAILAMMVLDAVPGAAPWAGGCAAVAGIVTAVRAWRWRLWTVLDVAHLWTLGLGYAWLAPALILKGYAQLGGAMTLGTALHAATIGALGTMTLVMMARTRLQRSKSPLTPFGDVAAAALLLTASALARIAAPLFGGMAALWLAAMAWSAAYAVLLRRLLPHGSARRD